MIALHLNLALCAAKEGEQGLARKHCTAVLGADAKNAKALFRRGTAASVQGDYEDMVMSNPVTASESSNGPSHQMSPHSGLIREFEGLWGKEALVDLQQAAELQPQDRLIRDELQTLHAR
eukprot:911848-Amphidinium_carterae.1